MANLLLLITNLIIKLIDIYRIYISPFLGCHCRFIPTCSQYSIKAIKKCGILKGIWMTCIRILKCNPLTKIHENLMSSKVLDISEKIN